MSTFDPGDFLDSMQSLILNNDLNSTYKLALIIAITEASLEINPQKYSASIARISFSELSRQFLKLYWNHGDPYILDHGQDSTLTTHILRQTINSTGNLKIISLIEDFKNDFSNQIKKVSFKQASNSEKFEKLIKDCNNSVLVKNPLKYISGFEFLFEINKIEKCIELTAPTINLLHRYHPMIIELAQHRWENHIRKLKSNSKILYESQTGTLKDFLFNNAKRENLQFVRALLVELGESRFCFYCGQPIRQLDIDHFLPFSRFRPFRLSNFVASCSHCNRSKSDRLADLPYKKEWVNRNYKQQQRLIEFGKACGIDPGFNLLNIHSDRLYKTALDRKEKLWTP